LEPTLAEHINIMVDVFREIRRVLKPKGTVWLNYGDCYATSANGRSAADTKAVGGDDRTFRDKPFSTIGGVLKPKDLCMVPNRLAIALQEDGWWVRSEIIWAKPNPMPESIKDRPATSHEKIFLLTKSERYFYDAESVRQPGSADSIDRYHRGRSTSHKWAEGGPGGQSIAKSFESMASKHPRRAKEHDNAAFPSSSRSHTGLSAFEAENGRTYATRNLRNYERAPLQVWEIATKPFSDAHFATFPPELAERCLRAGCPAGGTVLDPFGGAGTVGVVAEALGLNSILIELNPEYAVMAERRIAALRMGPDSRARLRQQASDPLPLFGGAAP